VTFADNLNGWAAGNSGVILHTTDGGTTWLQDHSGLSATLSGLSTDPAGGIWVCGRAGRISRFDSGIPPIPPHSAASLAGVGLLNYPNPFNPLTVITFNLPERMGITVRIYNTLGQEVRTLAEGEQFSPGEHTLVFDAQGSLRHVPGAGRLGERKVS